MTDVNELVDLGAERLGGAVMMANDEFFAAKDNLLKASPAEWREGEYNERGKWMDGWETRRRRTDGHDFCLVRLGVPGVIRHVTVDTSFFRGNFPAACSLEGCAVEGHPDADQLLGEATEWQLVLPQTPLAGDSANRFVLTDPHRFTHVRFRIFPDGGVARLRLHGEAMPHPRAFGRDGADIDLAAVENGGRVVASSDMFFGSGHNLIMPGRATNMGDGWETRRRRTPGHEWCVVRLAEQGTIRRVLVDTTHFKGNAPASCQIEVCDASSRPLDALLQDESAWREVLPLERLLPNTPHWFDDDTVRAQPPATHARIKIFPEGGVSRLRLWGPVAPRGREHAGMQRLNALLPQRLLLVLRACCGSKRWCEQMAARQPFGNFAALLESANTVWRGLDAADWREAFAAHPKIGEKPAASGTRTWSEQEQAGVRGASGDTLDALATLNQNYAAQFGYIYIVCATGKSADQMLGLLRERMQNDPATELPIAADEQRKITALRLEKWVVGG